MSGHHLALLLFLTAVAITATCVRLLRMPSVIAIVVGAMVGGGLFFGLGKAGVIDLEWLQRWAAGMNLGDAVLNGLLSFLLFAGALHVDLDELGAERRAIVVLGGVGAVISAAVVGNTIYLVLGVFAIEIELLEALLFGALISATDPIGVSGIVRSAAAPNRIRARMVGEAFVNATAAVILFTILLAVAQRGSASSNLSGVAAHILGALGTGFVTGYLASRLVNGVKEVSTQILITLTVVLGGIALSEPLDVSSPVVALVAGLVIGTRGRRRATTTANRVHVAEFWRLIDEVMTAILFLLIGIVAMFAPLTIGVVSIAFLSVGIVTLARWIAMTCSLRLIRAFPAHGARSARSFTWGALRGGIPIALALMLPDTGAAQLIVVITFVVVTSSIVISGLLFRPLVRRFV